MQDLHFRPSRFSPRSKRAVLCGDKAAALHRADHILGCVHRAAAGPARDGGSGSTLWAAQERFELPRTRLTSWRESCLTSAWAILCPRP